MTGKQVIPSGSRHALSSWRTPHSHPAGDVMSYHNGGVSPCASTGLPLAGHGIIGALKYLSNQGMNSIYVIPMNLGGDARDTHPFAEVDPRDFLWVPNFLPTSNGNAPFRPEDVFHYSIRRMDEWNTVVQYAMGRGILVQFQLHEQEFANLNWLAYDYDLSDGCAPALATIGGVADRG